MNHYSVVITTFDKRFQDCLKPLLTMIKAQRPDLEVIVMVNGRAKSTFNELFRKELLEFLSTMPNCFPTIFTNFQALAKMWNRGILTASEEQVLVLNDDLTITGTKSEGFFQELEAILKTNPGTFKLNGSFSHFIISKQQLLEVGYFDERLLGIGEEDGDFVWRYYETFAKEMPSIDMKYIENTGSDLADEGFAKGIRQYSKFNREFIKELKYQRSLLGGYKGMFDHRVKKSLSDEVQYPYESFYRKNIFKL